MFSQGFGGSGRFPELEYGQAVPAALVTTTQELVSLQVDVSHGPRAPHEIGVPTHPPAVVHLSA